MITIKNINIPFLKNNILKGINFSLVQILDENGLVNLDVFGT